MLWTAFVQSKLSSSTRRYGSSSGSTSTSALFFLTSGAAETHQASLRRQIKGDATNEVRTQPQADLCEILHLEGIPQGNKDASCL